MKVQSSKFQFLAIIISLLLFNVKDLSAQNFDSHEFKGNVFLDGKKAEGVVVKVFDDNDCSSEYKTKWNGKFIFIASCEKYYTLQFEKEGYVTKRIVIKTEDTRNLDFVTKTYKFDVSLVKKEQGVDYSSHDFPIAILELNPHNREFEFNKEYTKNRLKDIVVNSDNQIAKN